MSDLLKVCFFSGCLRVPRLHARAQENKRKAFIILVSRCFLQSINFYVLGYLPNFGSVVKKVMEKCAHLLNKEDCDFF